MAVDPLGVEQTKIYGNIFLSLINVYSCSDMCFHICRLKLRHTLVELTITQP